MQIPGVFIPFKMYICLTMATQMLELIPSIASSSPSSREPPVQIEFLVLS